MNIFKNQHKSISKIDLVYTYRVKTRVSFNLYVNVVSEAHNCTGVESRRGNTVAACMRDKRGSRRPATTGSSTGQTTRNTSRKATPARRPQTCDDTHPAIFTSESNNITRNNPPRHKITRYNAQSFFGLWLHFRQ